MNPLDLTGKVATEITRDRLRASRQSRLAKLARCCKPSAWRSAFGRLRTRVATPAPAACC